MKVSINQRGMLVVVGASALLSYSLLITLVVIYFDESMVLEGLLFLLTNFIISLCFFFLNKSGTYSSLFYLMYAVYFLVYIFKAVVLKISGLDTHYIFITIKTIVDNQGYIESLYVVTIGHIILILFFYAVLILNHKPSSALHTKRYLADRWMRRGLVYVLIWISFSSIVMMKFGVAVMGTESVSLPYRLSGVFFYSRTIVLPLLLLYFLEKSLVRQDQRLFKATLLVFLFLAISEIIVRATKAPLLFLVFYLSFLTLILHGHNINVKKIVSKKIILTLLLIAIIAFPLIEVYRALVVSQAEMMNFAMEMNAYNESSVHHGGNLFFVALERIFHRLVGFTQLSGLVSDGYFQHELSIIFSNDSFARYYTEYYLGYTIDGHLSSPSLLGVSIMFGRDILGILFFCSYLLLMVLLWNIAEKFRHFELSIKILLGYEVFNTMMSGTVDMSLKRITLIFLSAAMLELMIQNRRRISSKTRQPIQMPGEI